jgi:hypothetical protein
VGFSSWNSQCSHSGSYWLTHQVIKGKALLKQIKCDIVLKDFWPFDSFLIALLWPIL